MEIRPSITLSEDPVDEIEEYTAQFESRSAFLEASAWADIAQLRRAQRDAADIEVMDHHADELNAEVMNTWAYQVGL